MLTSPNPRLPPRNAATSPSTHKLLGASLGDSNQMVYDGMWTQGAVAWTGPSIAPVAPQLWRSYTPSGGGLAPVRPGALS